MRDSVDDVRAQRDALKALVIAAGFRNVDELLARPDRLDVARQVGDAARFRWQALRNFYGKPR